MPKTAQLPIVDAVLTDNPGTLPAQAYFHLLAARLWKVLFTMVKSRLVVPGILGDTREDLQPPGDQPDAQQQQRQAPHRRQVRFQEDPDTDGDTDTSNHHEAPAHDPPPIGAAYPSGLHPNILPTAPSILEDQLEAQRAAASSPALFQFYENAGVTTNGSNILLNTGGQHLPGSQQAAYQPVNRADHPDKRFVSRLLPVLYQLKYSPSAYGYAYRVPDLSRATPQAGAAFLPLWLKSSSSFTSFTLQAVAEGATADLGHHLNLLLQEVLMWSEVPGADWLVTAHRILHRLDTYCRSDKVSALSTEQHAELIAATTRVAQLSPAERGLGSHHAQGGGSATRRCHLHLPFAHRPSAPEGSTVHTTAKANSSHNTSDCEFLRQRRHNSNTSTGGGGNAGSSSGSSSGGGAAPHSSSNPKGK